MALERTKPNCGRLGLYYFEPEITPNIAHSVQLEAFCQSPVESWNNFSVQSIHWDNNQAENDVRVRILLESQFLNMRLHLIKLGLTSIRRIICTGGASENPLVLQVAADIFACPVYRSDGSGGAAKGAALRAKHALTGEIPELSAETELVATPNASAVIIYDQLLKYTALLQDYAQNL